MKIHQNVSLLIVLFFTIMISDSLFGNLTKPEYFVVAGTKAPIPIWSKYFFSIIILLLSERYFLRFYFRLYRKKRVMEDTPSSKMRSVAIGLVEINGAVEKIDKILEDPFDHMECVFYYVMIEKFDIKNEIWVVKHDEQRSLPFFLSDETGSVFIPSSLLAESYNNSVSNRNWERKIKYFGKIYSDYSKSKIKFDNSYEIDVKSVDEIPENIKKYCENNDIDFSDWPLKENRIRCTVAYVQPNDQLYILGKARILEDSEKELIHFSRSDDRVKIEHQNDVRVAIEHKDVEFFYVADTSEKEIIALLNGVWIKIAVTLLVTGWLIWSLIILN